MATGTTSLTIHAPTPRPASSIMLNALSTLSNGELSSNALPLTYLDVIHAHLCSMSVHDSVGPSIPTTKDLNRARASESSRFSNRPPHPPRDSTGSSRESQHCHSKTYQWVKEHERDHLPSSPAEPCPSLEANHRASPPPRPHCRASQC